jgi:glycosyltransferase involved in cell wall biosynthesis
MGWAVALDELAEPADVWHGMWAGSLPALERLRRRHGGRTIYDSRDVFMRSRLFARLGRPGRWLLEWAERHWAQRADRVMTVSEPYADLVEKDLHVARPVIVMNVRPVWTPPSPAPDLIRDALHLPPETAVVLYQGILTIERGIEQTMDAILDVPNAALVLMGFGQFEDQLADSVTRAPYLGRVFILPPVPPGDLLDWCAAADVLVIAYQPTTVNHLYTTPQKLFESFAAGVPVVASDMPGMAPIVRATGAGAVCDATSPASIAAAIRSIVEAPQAERRAMRERALRAAHDTYNWETQVGTLLSLYRELRPTTTETAR